jgi:pimeloyl-ACP methyl ester carboxylesterase
VNTLVLLPGMDGTGRFFADFVAALGGDVASVVGHYPLDPKLGYAELETVARSFLPSDQPYVLLGESFSGPIAISIAASRPANLLGVILCCTFARVGHRRLRAARSLLDWLPTMRLPIALAEWFLLGRFSSPRFRAELERVLRQVPAAVLRARFRATLDVDVAAALARIEIPVLYLRAAEDRLVPRQAAERIRRLRPRTLVEDFAAPHGLLQTVPHEAARVVRRFMDEDCKTART